MPLADIHWWYFWGKASGLDSSEAPAVPDYMLKENDQLTPLMLKEPLPGRQLILAQHDSLTVSQAAERFIEMFTSI